jgi:hypothetical protein
MKGLDHLHGWLTGAAILLIGQTLVLFALTPSLIAAAAVGVAMVVMGFVLAGSRIAWTVAIIGSLGQVVEGAILGERYGGIVVGVLAAMCLAMPSSVRWVWSRPQKLAR